MRGFETSYPRYSVPHRINALGWLIAVSLLVVLTPTGRSFADITASDPAHETQSMVAQAIAILRNSNISIDERRRLVIKLAARKLDFERMARGSLGPHWTELTLSERDRFVSLFTGFFEAAYLNKIQDYSNLEIRVANETFAGRNYARVDATVIEPASDNVPITFLLARHGSNWMVYDVEFENVGMIENYRAQFDRIIRAHGIAQLMADLQAKQAQLGAALGTRRGSS
jgi:phospholipid transport system substrate-binding protein